VHKVLRVGSIGQMEGHEVKWNGAQVLCKRCWSGARQMLAKGRVQKSRVLHGVERCVCRWYWVVVTCHLKSAKKRKGKEKGRPSAFSTLAFLTSVDINFNVDMNAVLTVHDYMSLEDLESHHERPLVKAPASQPRNFVSIANVISRDMIQRQLISVPPSIHRRAHSYLHLARLRSRSPSIMPRSASSSYLKLICLRGADDLGLLLPLSAAAAFSRRCFSFSIRCRSLSILSRVFGSMSGCSGAIAAVGVRWGLEARLLRPFVSSPRWLAETCSLRCRLDLCRDRP
jgi:hypothetical protein